MRKAIFQAATGLLCAILSVGCTSDQLDQREDPSQEIQVTFNVSPLSVSTGEIPGTGTGTRAKAATRAAVSGEDLGDLVKEIGYYIYKGEDLYKSGSVSFDPATQEAPEGFGSFQERILPGSYDVCFYAFGKNTGKPDKEWSSSKSSFCFNDNNDKASNNVELFIYKGTMTITGSQTEINVTLQRVSALLSIQISDDPLEEVAYMKYEITNYPKYYPFPSNYYTPISTEKGYQIITNVVNGELPVTDIYFMNTKEYRSLTISIYDHADQMLGSQEVSVPLYPNRRTIVSGNLFSNLGDKPLTITINDSWGADVPVNLN